MYDPKKENEPLSPVDFVKNLLLPLKVIQKSLGNAIEKTKGQTIEFNFRLLSCATGRTPNGGGDSFHAKLHKGLAKTFVDYFSKKKRLFQISYLNSEVLLR
ncbi:MAG: hypothetical protein JWR25_2254 [Noviherbaspirillum sp.]|nr:hypothetical protein [Noviherbaspirillum sp.]